VGERVLVHGAGGGLGSAVVQVATALGAEVLAVAGSPARRDLARDAGLRCLAPEGRLVTVGFTSGAIPQAPANRLLLRNVGVLGAAWRELLDHDHTLFARTAEQLANLVHAGLRPLVTQQYDLAHGATALRAIEERVVAGKVVLTTR
jgi:NADPH2:quinone reductase